MTESSNPSTPTTTNNFVLNVATVNGSGSQSANNILLKAFFRMGLPVSGKNLFPSNIAGLPTWFAIRVNSCGFVAKGSQVDIMVAMNPQTVQQDMGSVTAGGVFIYNTDLKIDPETLRHDIKVVPIPFRDLMAAVEAGVKIKKLLTNLAYVGIVARLLKVDFAILEQTIRDFFADKASVVDLNVQAMHAGWNYVEQNLSAIDFPFAVQPLNENQGKILIDGNSAAALGLLYGGCTFVSWYPITPSSSLVESFSRYAEQYRKDAEGRNTFAVVQAEDELAAICMVLGAGWAGARAATATSGPGLSLMGEAAGYAYYAEIPAVIWNVQRVGPSTGMPTRTQQGDVNFAAHLSHGDTRHALLFPGNPQECFEFGQTGLDLAERLQTLVIVMSDLDLGMNFWTTDEFKPPAQPLDRGKVLSTAELEARPNYGRYTEVDGDGIAYRSLPGTAHPKSAYLTRGSGHAKTAGYTEDPREYQEVVDRLTRKLETAKTLMPQPVVERGDRTMIGIIAYGSTDPAVSEARSVLSEQHGLTTSYMRLRAFPFAQKVEDFLSTHQRIYVVEQNREGQMAQLLSQEFPHLAAKLRRIRHYNGQPIEARHIVQPLIEMEAL